MKGVLCEDGLIRFWHKDKLETVHERDARLAHNQFMRMSRTFKSSQAAKLVGQNTNNKFSVFLF